MAIIAEWVLACSNCEAEVFRSLPMLKPKQGDYLAAQQWVHMNGKPTQVGDPYICGRCCTWFQPMVEFLSMKRFIGDDHEGQ
jgi:hypothetical protein